MPNLDTISLDWFSYLIPELQVIQKRQEDCDNIDIEPMSGF